RQKQRLDFAMDRLEMEVLHNSNHRTHAIHSGSELHADRILPAKGIGRRFVDNEFSGFVDVPSCRKISTLNKLDAECWKKILIYVQKCHPWVGLVGSKTIVVD